MGQFAFRSISLTWLAIALGLTACGGSSNSSSNSSKPDVPTLKQGVLRNGQLGGMATQSATPITTATDWAAGDDLSSQANKAEVARLKKIGFVAGLSLPLVTKNNSNRYGLTAVEQFKASSGAKAELTHTVSTNGPWTSFAVPGIPGARGFEQGGAAGGGRNIAFTHGDYYFIIGSGWQNGSSNAVPRAAIITAALALYHRVAH